MSDYWDEEEIKELERIKSCGLGGRSPDDIFQLGASLYSFVKENFPINGVPKRIHDTLLILKERFSLSTEQWDLTIDIIINEIKLSKSKQVYHNIHKCSQGDFTCHYLGKHLTLTYQEYGKDSVHCGANVCPFCGHKEIK